MFVILLTANFKFRNRSTCSKGPIKRAGKVCGDSQDLESPGCDSLSKTMESLLELAKNKNDVSVANKVTGYFKKYQGSS